MLVMLVDARHLARQRVPVVGSMMFVVIPFRGNEQRRTTTIIKRQSKSDVRWKLENNEHLNNTTNCYPEKAVYEKNRNKINRTARHNSQVGY